MIAYRELLTAARVARPSTVRAALDRGLCGALGLKPTINELSAQKPIALAEFRVQAPNDEFQVVCEVFEQRLLS